jgi:hypothetical protein
MVEVPNCLAATSMIAKAVLPDGTVNGSGLVGSHPLDTPTSGPKDSPA